MIFPFPIAAEESADEILAGTKYSSEERRAIAEILADAESIGIDGAYLLPRLKEAKAKRVPALRLINALEKEIYYL